MTIGPYTSHREKKKKILTYIGNIFYFLGAYSLVEDT